MDKLNLPARLYPIDRDPNRVRLRGKSFSQGDIAAGRARFPYRVPDKDQTPAADYFGRAIANVAARTCAAHDARRLRARNPRQGYRSAIARLRDWKNRDLLLAGMSSEELALAEDSSGYDDWIEGETGLDEMDYAFVHDDESKPFRTIAGGYQRLPLTPRRTGPASRRERLDACASRQPLKRAGRPPPCRARRCRQAIRAQRRAWSSLALPRRGLERIDEFPAKPAAMRTSRGGTIASVTPIPACKTLLLYKRPWWRDHGIIEGRSITDMPARQFYCLGSETTRSLPGEDTSGYGVH